MSPRAVARGDVGLTSVQRDAMVDGELGQTLSSSLSEPLNIVVPVDWWQIGKIAFFASEPLTEFSEYER